MKLKKLLMILIFLICMLLGTNIVSAAGATISANSYNVNVGETVTISVSFTAATWNIEVTGDGISGGTYVGYTEDLSEKTTNKNFSLNTSTAGTYTITMTGTITDVKGTTTKVDETKKITVSNPTPTPEPEPTPQPDPETPTTPTTPTTEKKSTEARLKDFGIKPKEYDFSGFKSNTYEYTAKEVPNDVTEVELYATPKDSNAKVTGTGKVSLKEGENTIKVEVTAEDGTTKKTYTIKVTRQKEETKPTEVTQTPETPTTTEEPEEKPLQLSELSIKNVNLSPKFNPEKYDYTVGLTEDITSLEIEAKANSEKATLEIVGNEDLKQGENIITILLTDTKTEETATYQITVNKNVKTAETVGKVEWLKPSTWGLKEKIIVAVVTVLIVIIIVAIVMKIRLSRYDGEEEVEFPGAEELDKALAEHQELADDKFSFDDNEYEPEEYDINDFYIKNDKKSFEQKENEDTLEDENNMQNEENYYGRTSGKRKGKHF